MTNPPDPDNIPTPHTCRGINPCPSCRDRLAERADGTPVSPHEADRDRPGVRSRGFSLSNAVNVGIAASATAPPPIIGDFSQYVTFEESRAAVTAVTTARDTYTRAVTVVDVIDGDTFRCEVDLGFYVRVRMSCRLAGLNAPEHNQPGGIAVRSWLEAILFPAGKPAPSVVVQSVRADKFAGRFDAIVMVDGVNVNDLMIQLGFAVPWDGTGPRPLVPWPPVSAEGDVQ